MGSSDKHGGLFYRYCLMFRWFYKHKPYKPLSFSSAELAICGMPILYESVTLDSLDKPQMADALTPLKKMAGNKPK